MVCGALFHVLLVVNRLPVPWLGVPMRMDAPISPVKPGASHSSFRGSTGP